MFAIVEIAGDQYKVFPEQKLKVPHIKIDTGNIVEFNKILAVNDGNNLNIGMPFIEGSITAKVIGNGKSDKVLVFHKKRRKGYQKLNGHRQEYTIIEIQDFNIPGFEYKKQLQATKEIAEDHSLDLNPTDEFDNFEVKDSELLSETEDNAFQDLEDTENFDIDLDKKEK